MATESQSLIREIDLDTFKLSFLYFVIGFATLCYWESTWSSIDLLQPYLQPWTLHVVVYLVSLVGLFSFAVLSPILVKCLKQKRISTEGKPEKTICSKSSNNNKTIQGPSSNDRADKDRWIHELKTNVVQVYKADSFRNLSSILLIKVAIYFYALFMVGSWFAPWGLIDFYFINKFSPVFVYLTIHFVSTAVLIACQKLSFVVQTPFHDKYETDLGINLLVPFLGRKHAPKESSKLVISSCSKVLFGTLVFLYWYSVWGLCSLVAEQVLQNGFASLPSVMLPFIAMMAYIPNFFVMSDAAMKTKNFLVATLLSYIQGLANVIFWICFWQLSSRLLPKNQGVPVLQHFLSFGILAAFGVAINCGI